MDSLEHRALTSANSMVHSAHTPVFARLLFSIHSNVRVRLKAHSTPVYLCTEESQLPLCLFVIHLVFQGLLKVVDGIVMIMRPSRIIRSSLFVQTQFSARLSLGSDILQNIVEISRGIRMVPIDVQSIFEVLHSPFVMALIGQQCTACDQGIDTFGISAERFVEMEDR